jgi:hypothetical protein
MTIDLTVLPDEISMRSPASFQNSVGPTLRQMLSRIMAQGTICPLRLPRHHEGNESINGVRGNVAPDRNERDCRPRCRFL